MNRILQVGFVFFQNKSADQTGQKAEQDAHKDHDDREKSGREEKGHHFHGLFGLLRRLTLFLHLLQGNFFDGIHHTRRDEREKNIRPDGSDDPRYYAGQRSESNAIADRQVATPVNLPMLAHGNVDKIIGNGDHGDVLEPIQARVGHGIYIPTGDVKNQTENGAGQGNEQAGSGGAANE